MERHADARSCVTLRNTITVLARIQVIGSESIGNVPSQEYNLPSSWLKRSRLRLVQSSGQRGWLLGFRFANMLDLLHVSNNRSGLLSEMRLGAHRFSEVQEYNWDRQESERQKSEERNFHEIRKARSLEHALQLTSPFASQR